MSADYIPDKRPLTACPACGSGRIASVVGTTDELEFCMKCHQVWERLPAGEPYTVDGEQLAFKVPCDNCAFRGGSGERADPEAWKDLQQTLSVGGRFYCHKAVPFDPTAEKNSFDFPRKDPGTVVIEGETHRYQRYDTERMRLCRGYLNAHIGPQLRKDFADESL